MTHVLGNAYVALTGAANQGNNAIAMPPEERQNIYATNSDPWPSSATVTVV